MLPNGNVLCGRKNKGCDHDSRFRIRLGRRSFGCFLPSDARLFRSGNCAEGFAGGCGSIVLGEREAAKAFRAATLCAWTLDLRSSVLSLMDRA